MTAEEQIFTIISTTGTAKSMYLKALQEFKEGHFEKADELMKSGDQCLIEGHKIHSIMVQQEAAGNAQPVSLLLVHAEDQFMSSEVIKEVVKELMSVYRELRSVKEKNVN